MDAPRKQLTKIAKLMQKERKKNDDRSVEIYMMKHRKNCSAHVYFKVYYNVRP